MLFDNIFIKLIYKLFISKSNKLIINIMLEILILILLIFIKKMLRFIMILKYNGYNYYKVITNNI